MRQIRRGVFETNSSSVHSLTMCMADDFDKWRSGDMLWDRWGDKFVTNADADKLLADYRNDFLSENPDYIRDDEEWEDKFNRYLRYNYDKQFYTYDEFNDYDYIEFETFVGHFTTPNGERIVSFGYYGHD